MLIFPLCFSTPHGDPGGSSLVLRQVTSEPHKATETKTNQCEEETATKHGPSFFGTALRALNYCVQPLPGSENCLGHWVVVSPLPSSLPSALTSALFFQ